MGNIFAPAIRVQGSGLLPITLGVGPIVGGYSNMGLNYEAAGGIAAASSGVINHHHNGLPFDEDGRLLTQAAAVDHYDQGIGFTASGFVAIIAAGAGYYDQGAKFTDGRIQAT